MLKKALLTLLTLALAAFGVACLFGYGGRVIGYLHVLAFPKDRAQLAYLPQESSFAGFLQVPLAREPQTEKLRKEAERLHAEVEKTTGIRLALDVDSVAVGDAVLVARGRFDWPKMRAALGKSGFEFEEHQGVPLAVGKLGALALDGPYLVAAQNVKAVKAALERKERGAGLSEDAALLRPLDALGWRHPVFGSLDMTALSGLFGSQLPVKNVAGRLDTLKAALGVGLRLTATTPDKARELHTKLEELRREVLEGIEGKPGAEGWAAVVKGASIRQDRDAVAIDLTVPEKLLEELQKETERASADAMSWVDQLGAGASGQTLGNDAADRAPSAVSTPVTGAEPETSRPLLSARAPVSWAPLAWAAGFATLLLLTVPRRGRPGFFGLLLSPAFALPAVLATTGFFFLVQLPVPAPWRFWLSAASLPIPDLDQLLFGASAVANPLFYSALVPFLLSPLGVRLEGARRALCGFSCGYAGALASAAWLGAPTLAWLGPAYLAVPWLVLNTLICLFAARAMLSAQER